MGRKNSQIHLNLETEMKLKLQHRAAVQHLTIAEFCRQRLRGNSQLDTIEFLMEKICKLLICLVQEKSAYNFYEKERTATSKN